MRYTQFRKELLVAICNEADLPRHYMVDIEKVLTKYSFDIEASYWFSSGIGDLKDAGYLIRHDTIIEDLPITGRVSPTPAGLQEAKRLAEAGVAPTPNPVLNAND